MVKFLAVSVLLFTAACPSPPASEMERRARLAAAGELSVKQCAGFVGGYEAARAVKADANTNVIAARSLGATDADIEKARSDVRSTFHTTAAFSSIPEACNSLVGSLAWATG